ncbi:protein phosphatase 2C domain-containing protein [Streptomyces sp. SYSU K21746]
MSQQGERSTSGEDDWWNRLYDESAPDMASAPGDTDTLEDRFNSAAGTVTPPPPPSAAPPRPRAPWEPPAAQPPATATDFAAAGPAAAHNAPPPIPEQPPEPSTPLAAEDPRAARPGAHASQSDGPAAPAPPAPPPPPAQGPPDPPPPSVPPKPSDTAVPAASPDPSAPPSSAGREVPPAPPSTPPPVSPPAPPRPAGAARTGGRPRHAAPAPAPPPPPPVVGYVGGRPPTYDPEPTALPAAEPATLDDLVADTVLDGARYGTYTLRAVSLRGDSARYRGEPRRDSLLTARFGTGEAALVLVALAGGARAAEGAQPAAADVCRWIGGAVGRSHARLSEDIRAGRRGDLKSGLHRLTDRSYGKLRARAAELGLEPGEYTATLRCLLLPADPECRTRVFFGIGAGGLFRLRDGAWQDIEPQVAAATGEPVVGYGSVPSESAEGDRLTMDLGITTAPSPYVESLPPRTEPFRFRASVARPGDTLLLCSNGLAEPLRGEPALAELLAERWAPPDAPGLAAFLADTQLRVKGYADDRTAAAVWEA